MLRVSAFYLEKQKSFIAEKNIFLAKKDQKDSVSRPNFQWKFCSIHFQNATQKENIFKYYVLKST